MGAKYIGRTTEGGSNFIASHNQTQDKENKVTRKGGGSPFPETEKTLMRFRRGKRED